MHYIPGLRLRVSEETEIIGIDECDMGEFAYDYVGLQTEIKSSYARSTAYEAHDSDIKERSSAWLTFIHSNSDPVGYFCYLFYLILRR